MIPAFFKNSIVFEPTKKTFKLLQSNIFLNGVDDKIKAYNLAISNKKANLHLAIKKGNIGGNYISTNKKKNTEKLNLFGDSLISYKLK